MYSVAIPFIAKYEGLELSPYYCPAFKLTIGYGELIKPNGKYGGIHGSKIINVAETLLKMHGKNRASLNTAIKNAFNNIITVGEAQEVLKRHLVYKWQQISDKLPLGLTDNQCAAILSLTYNIGVGAFLKSTVLKKIIAGNIEGASRAFLFFNKARVDGALTALPGLTNRRKAEMELFLK